VARKGGAGKAVRQWRRRCGQQGNGVLRKKTGVSSVNKEAIARYGREAEGAMAAVGYCRREGLAGSSDVPPGIRK